MAFMCVIYIKANRKGVLSNDSGEGVYFLIFGFNTQGDAGLDASVAFSYMDVALKATP